MCHHLLISYFVAVDAVGWSSQLLGKDSKGKNVDSLLAKRVARSDCRRACGIRDSLTFLFGK